MASTYRWIPISDFRGGQNSTAAPLDLKETEVVLMRNGDTFRVKMFRKRGGAASLSIGSVFAGQTISSLIAHYPDNNPAHAELWAVDDASTPHVGRMAGASTFSAVTVADNVATGFGAKVRGVSYNGKLFLVYDAGTSAAYVWDPNLAVPKVRKWGLIAPNGATITNTGSGSYAATSRYYRTRERIKHSGIIDAQSEPANQISGPFTPSGSGTAARVTQGTPAINPESTHWVVEGSADGVTYYELAEVAIATTTYDDSADPATYAFGTLSAVLGAFTTFFDFTTSPKYVCAAFNRVFFMGGYGSSPQSRVWFTPAKGTADKGDDERIPNTLTVRNWVDLDEAIGGDGTGLIGPVYGSLYVFKYARIKTLTPTGGSSPVFDTVELSATRGALEQECICLGEDAKGRTTVYFLDSQVGPMMIAGAAPIPIGDERIGNLWDSVNLAATTKVGQVIDYPNKSQVWFWFATGASNDPNILAVYDKRNGGWDVYDTGGQIRLARAAVLFAKTLGASMSRDKVPYVAYTGATNKLLRADTTDTSDDGTTFQSVVKTRPYAFNGGKPFRTSTPYLLATPASGVTLTITADADFGRDVRSATVDLTKRMGESSATRVYRRCEGLDLANTCFVQYQIGDASAIANSWQIEQLYVPVMALDTDP